MEYVSNICQIVNKILQIVNKISDEAKIYIPIYFFLQET